jgi:hypothetical protein
LVVGEDTSYPLYGDPSSAFAYTIASLTYDREFVAQPSFPLGNVRYVRYLIQNPFDQPVVLYQQLAGGTWSVTEQWVDEVLQHNQFADKFGGSYRTDDGAILDTSFAGNIGAPFALTPPQCFFFPISSSCGPPSGTSQLSWHPNGLPTQYACSPVIPVTPGLSNTVLESSAGLSAEVLLNPGIRGNEPAGNAAARTSDNGFILPAAAGGVPGRAVLYAARPAAVGHADPLVARVESYDPATLIDQPRYQRWIGDWLDPSEVSCSCVFDPASGQTSCNTPGLFMATRGVHVLHGSTSTIAGTLSISTGGLQPSGTIGFGQSTVVLNANLARSFNQ